MNLASQKKHHGKIQQQGWRRPKIPGKAGIGPFYWQGLEGKGILLELTSCQGVQDLFIHLIGLSTGSFPAH